MKRPLNQPQSLFHTVFQLYRVDRKVKLPSKLKLVEPAFIQIVTAASMWLWLGVLPWFVIIFSMNLKPFFYCWWLCLIHFGHVYILLQANMSGGRAAIWKLLIVEQTNLDLLVILSDFNKSNLTQKFPKFSFLNVRQGKKWDWMMCTTVLKLCSMHTNILQLREMRRCCRCGGKLKTDSPYTFNFILYQTPIIGIIINT